MINATAVIHPAVFPLPYLKPQQKAKKPPKRLVSRHFRGNTHRGARIKDDVWIDAH